MWYDLLENNRFLRNLYENIPNLNNVRISEIKFRSEGKIVTIIFDMPIYADKPPEKWDKAGYNTVVIEIDFIDIIKISLDSARDIYHGDIDIYKMDKGTIGVKIQGGLELSMISRFAMIQSIRGYCNE